MGWREERLFEVQRGLSWRGCEGVEEQQREGGRFEASAMPSTSFLRRKADWSSFAADELTLQYTIYSAGCTFLTSRVLLELYIAEK